MASNTVVIFGAGATKACGGPLTNEILGQAFEPKVRREIEREYYIDLLDRFLVENFFLSPQQAKRKDADYPALPLLLSLVDTAIDRNQPMGPEWSVEKLRQVRRALQYMVFALLEFRLRHLPHNYYRDLLRHLDPAANAPPVIISLNYDDIVDNAMIWHSSGLPDYGCSITTERYNQLPHYGKLLKIHGSLNWSYCPGCNRLDLGVSESGRSTIKLLDELYQANSLEERYSCQGFACPRCSTHVEPILITPTHLKDYRNPHVAQVWMLAEEALRNAQRVFIIGYSLPDDDLDVIYLLKRGLAELVRDAPQNITVVEHARTKGERSLGRHPAGRRFRTIFGPDITWFPDGFENWVPTFGRKAAARVH